MLQKIRKIYYKNRGNFRKMKKNRKIYYKK